MRYPIQVQRLKDTFIQLAGIESPSRQEGPLAEIVAKIFSQEFGTEVLEDSSKGQTGSQTGNLIIRIPGKVNAPPVFFNAHLDTVEPCRGIHVLFKDGIFTSDGTTILGADDKAAIAILIEAARVLKETGLPHPPMEYVFTVCEEIGLLGAKALDTGLLQARAGYALDSIDPEVIINQAPCATRFTVKIIGRAAHAGLNPEHGINSIRLAAEAIARIPMGRLDPDTTANIGLIRGGKATNIVPAEVIVEGEVRSHREERLREVQDKILATFYKVVRENRSENSTGRIPEPLLPLAQTEVRNDYPLMSVSEEHPLVTTAYNAAKSLGRNLRHEKTGGGSDANVFNGKGIATVIMGIGMQKVHTTEEYIRLDDMVSTTELVLEIIRQWRAFPADT